MLELQTANKNKRTKNGGEGITALYCRLSVDDNGTEGESNSIKNQRDILGRYAKQHGYRNIEYYIDDGYSGTNFNRPDFQRMMSDVDEGKVKTIIVKDMSRLGRDYLKVGYLTEFTFAEKDIHFIAINDNVDSENGSDNELIPFKNVFNEWLARDTSKKIRAVIRNKGESGKPLTNTPPIGYMKDPNDKNKWLIDERCAPTIREIFRLCVNGYNALAIAKILTEKGYDTPKAFYLKQGRNMYRNDTTEPYLWHRSTVYKILRNPNYIGHLVNFKTTRKSYKNKRFVYRDPSEWKIIENHHEAIVDISGTQAKKRPAFLQMVQDAKQKKFDLIVTREVCRFARNTVDTLVVTRELKNYGVEVYFVEDDIRTMDGDGELRLTIMATLAQEESRKISERVRAGQKISRDNGVLYGNGNILGYDRLGDTYVINEDQAETVRIIYDLYLKGNGFNKIVNELVRLKRKDSSGLVRWDATKVSRILHNATYKGYQGYYKSHKNNHLDQKTIINRDEDTYLYVKGRFPPIISEEVWDKCKALRESKLTLRKTQEGKLERTGTRTSEDIWAKRLICRCGHRMRKDRWHVNKTGLTYGYKCYNVLNNGSKQTRIDAGLDADKYCDMGTIADWKFDLMLRELLKALNLITTI